MTRYTQTLNGCIYVITVTYSEVVVNDYSGECFRTSKVSLPNLYYLTELIRIYNLGVSRDQENYYVAIRNIEGRLLFIGEYFNSDETYDYYINSEGKTFTYTTTMKIQDVSLITPQELLDYYYVD